MALLQQPQFELQIHAICTKVPHTSQRESPSLVPVLAPSTFPTRHHLVYSFASLAAMNELHLTTIQATGQWWANPCLSASPHHLRSQAAVVAALFPPSSDVKLWWIPSPTYLVTLAAGEGPLWCLLHPSIRHQGTEKQGHSTNGGR